MCVHMCVCVHERVHHHYKLGLLNLCTALHNAELWSKCFSDHKSGHHTNFFQYVREIMRTSWRTARIETPCWEVEDDL